MSFAALDFLAGVEAARPAGFRCLDGLANLTHVLNIMGVRLLMVAIQG
jgi:hypothetical protein